MLSSTSRTSRRSTDLGPLGLVLVAFALALAAGCKKEDAPPSLSSGELVAPQQATTPQRAHEPEEACVVACAPVTGTSDERFTALDDCMMDSCYGDPPMEDPTVAACDAIGPGKISYGVVARDRCLARSCCAKARDCGGDPSCAARLACVMRCKAR
ncbi:MAG: hypothetical protein IPF92_12325 [Myxococcales bacterium]|nr:hypothetical protein [Myxococcales bacterium]MBL0198138.1 hypothetical protein [Myxococcales bacterium]HQY62712.1 hypothetical protein [Polyangiaceae bacterium]